MRAFFLPTFALFSLTFGQDLRPTEDCPLLGPTFPADFDISTTDAFAQAKAAFPRVINSLFESGIVNASLSSFMLDVYSTTTNRSIYSYSHQATAPSMNESFPAGGINDGTIFRVGSVSKLFTTYSILAYAGGVEVLSHPVTRYLPELAGNSRNDPLNKIVWEDMTIGSLASHMGGTGGFPLTLLACISPEDTTCNTTYFLDYLRNMRVPAQPIHQSSEYSDCGFGVLGRILERMTGQNYNQAVQSVLSQSLGLKNSGSIMPTGDNLNAIIIPVTSLGAWGFDNQISAPSGGIYSTAADFRTMGLSILHSQLLTPANTRAWMKPRAHLASMTNSVGAPWEINRMTLPVSRNSTRYRISDLYTKSGGQPGYTAILALSPDHGIGLSILVAGSTASGDRWKLRAALGETFVVAAEHALMENAGRNFPGTYATQSNSTTNTTANTTVTITVDSDSPGVGLAQFFINGVDARLNISEPGLELPSSRKQIIRLYPTGLEQDLSTGGKLRKYRAVPEIKPGSVGLSRAKIEGGTSLFDDVCGSWFNTAFFDGPNGQFYDEFWFEFDGQGKVISVRYPLTGAVMRKV